MSELRSNFKKAYFWLILKNSPKFSYSQNSIPGCMNKVLKYNDSKQWRDWLPYIVNKNKTRAGAAQRSTVQSIAALVEDLSLIQEGSCAPCWSFQELHTLHMQKKQACTHK